MERVRSSVSRDVTPRCSKTLSCMVQSLLIEDLKESPCLASVQEDLDCLGRHNGNLQRDLHFRPIIHFASVQHRLIHTLNLLYVPLIILRTSQKVLYSQLEYI